ncbi:MAG: hypothetical protein CMO43_04830 [Verrucomicrobiales bacterium]|jgi:hypothetical protein|nr:hypothetical protein [Verrucomicrobiales bacterium]MDP6754462.1 hypothetical protein [Verrucomicrobiota bacterium]
MKNKLGMMLQKLENTYLAILRTVVIVASGILLAGAVLFGLGALEGFGDGPSDEINPPNVPSRAVIKKMLEPISIPEENQQTGEGATPSPVTRNPNQKHYDSAAKTIIDFVVMVSGGTQSLNERQIGNIIKGRSESIHAGTQELTAAYAEGISEAMKMVLADKKIEELARKSSPVDVVNQLLDTFTDVFNTQIEAEQGRITVALEEHSQAQVESVSNLSIAAVCFGMFLLIVFLSIFIKIERNLRHIDIKSPV